MLSLRRCLISVAMVGAALLISGCDAGRVSKAKKDAASQLRDPSSAQFRNVKTTPGYVCGEINGKNGYGAYSGFVRFYADKTTANIDPQDDSEPFMGVPSRSAAFDKYWSALCK